MKMEAGDVLFFKGTDAVSKAISWVEGSSYTHVALYTGNGKLIEANYGITTQERDILPSEVFEVHRFKDITEAQRTKMIAAARQLIGYKYDVWQIGRDFIRIELRVDLSFIEWKNHAVCSDIIDVPAYIAGIKRHSFLRVGDVTPSELLWVYNLPKVE